jgi:hypothetical protein
VGPFNPTMGSLGSNVWVPEVEAPLISRDARVIMTDCETPGKPSFVVGQIDVVVIRGIAVQSWFVCPTSVEACRKGDLRCRMAIVCVDAKPAEKPRKKRESLLPLRLKSLNMCARSVDRLCLLVGPACSVEVGDECGRRIDRVGELFVKPTCLQNTNG